MSSHATDLFKAAGRLDEKPEELLNGGATDALRVLADSVEERDEAAAARGIDKATVSALWDRADALLRSAPSSEDELFPTAANAAVVLYGAAWVLGSDSVGREDVLALM
jgi:hypothetical protein